MTPRNLPLRRRTVLRSAAGGVATLGTLGLPSAATADPLRGSSSGPVSMAMHLHSSFSEGVASMHAHLEQAKRVGVDVLWWTDHDFRVTAMGYRQAIRFDGPDERENNANLHWQVATAQGVAGHGHDFVTYPRSPDEDGRALQLHATAQGGEAWGHYLLYANAWNDHYSTSYADTTLQLDVLVQAGGPDAEAVVRIGSSFRPASGGRPAGRYRLEYRIGGGPAARWTEDGGLLGVVRVPAAAQRWERVTLRPASDHAALWPDTVAGDASLRELYVGARSRRGATARVVLDRLRFERTRRTPADATALVDSIVAEYRERYRWLKQYPAAEISLVNHLNAFGGERVLPNYGTSLHKDTSLQAQREMVRWLHDRGAVVSINHPGGQGDALARKLVTHNGVGADVIEIGTGGSLPRLTWHYDVAARNAVFLTASGVTDDHMGYDWLSPKRQRWVTSVWAGGREADELAGAVARGRAWFWDPLHWKGELDLRVNGKAPMGGVLFTSDDRVDVKVTATRLPSGGSLQFVVGRCDRPGVAALRPAIRSRRVPPRDIRRGTWRTRVERGNGAYVRATVRAADGKVVGFSNPTWILPKRLAGEVRVPDRRLFEE